MHEHERIRALFSDDTEGVEITYFLPTLRFFPLSFSFKNYLTLNTSHFFLDRSPESRWDQIKLNKILR